MTDEEKMELEALRAEKHSREQTERAKAALSAAGVSAGFAALLVGADDADDADTDKRVQDFCAAYQSSLSEDIKKRLPEQPPTLTAPLPQRPKRGIQRIR